MKNFNHSKNLQCERIYFLMLSSLGVDPFDPIIKGNYKLFRYTEILSYN